MNSLLLDALNSSNFSGMTPIWLMRQAGRYLPEYRKLREGHSFLEMCHLKELIVDITLMPIKRFGFDAAILFSDILLIAEALGCPLEFQEGVGPIFQKPLRKSDIDKLSLLSVVDHLEPVREAIQELKRELKVPLIGFCGAPFTVASYMIEGKSSSSLLLTKEWLFKDPVSFHRLLTLLKEASIINLNLQIDAGVDCIQIFDTWSSHLGALQFEEFSLRYMKEIIEGLKRKVPVILFCRASSGYAENLAALQPSAISLDWTCDLSTMRKRIPKGIALQGNLDPDVLLAPNDVIKTQVRSLVRAMKKDPGYVFNLGHGITPNVSVDAVHALIEAVRE